jgi:hypothetical protein
VRGTSRVEQITTHLGEGLANRLAHASKSFGVALYSGTALARPTIETGMYQRCWGAYTIGPSRTFGTGAEPCKRWYRQTTRLLTIYWYEHSPEAML